MRVFLLLVKAIETSIFDPGNSGKQYYHMELVDHVHYSGQKWNDLQRFS